MMKCFNCGTEIADELQRCPECKSLKATKENLKKVNRSFKVWIILLIVIMVCPSFVEGDFVLAIPGVLPLIFAWNAISTRKKMIDFLEEEKIAGQDAANING